MPERTLDDAKGHLSSWRQRQFAIRRGCLSDCWELADCVEIEKCYTPHISNSSGGLSSVEQ
jgi:hypothetical protein